MMKTLTLTAPLTIGAGTPVVLTPKQLRDRAHLVEISKTRKDGSVLAEAKAPLSFKAGEALEIDEASLPKGVAAMVTAPIDTAVKAEKKPSAAALDKARAEGVEEGVAAGRKAMLAEVEAYNTLLDAVDIAQDAHDGVLADDKADDAAKAAAQKAVQDAQAAADAAKPKA